MEKPGYPMLTAAARKQGTPKKGGHQSPSTTHASLTVVMPRYQSRTAVSHVSDIAPYTPSRSH